MHALLAALIAAGSLTYILPAAAVTVAVAAVAVDRRENRRRRASRSRQVLSILGPIRRPGTTRKKKKKKRRNKTACLLNAVVCFLNDFLRLRNAAITLAKTGSGQNQRCKLTQKRQMVFFACSFLRFCRLNGGGECSWSRRRRAQL
eukprot:COSAG06_NODE_8919_length_2032_cov_3.031040_2_plen_146_part_00